MHALQPDILYHISVEMIHIPGVTLVYGHSLLCSGMQVIGVLPHETSRHTDENSTNQALHSNTFYYCKSKVQVLSRHESQRTSSSRTQCVKVTAWRTERVLLRWTIGLRLSTLNVTPTCCSNFSILASVRNTTCSSNCGC